MFFLFWYYGDEFLEVLFDLLVEECYEWCGVDDVGDDIDGDEECEFDEWWFDVVLCCEDCYCYCVVGCDGVWKFLEELLVGCVEGVFYFVCVEGDYWECEDVCDCEGGFFDVVGVCCGNDGDGE